MDREAAPDFFEPRDQLQVRYEMLRSHRVDEHKVAAVCQRYGVSRQTFYNLQERFLSGGTAGLLSRKRGPKGPSKLTGELLQLVERRLQQEPELSGGSLASQIEDRFGVAVHKRTLEKLLKELRSKKKPLSLTVPRKDLRTRRSAIAPRFATKRYARSFSRWGRISRTPTGSGFARTACWGFCALRPRLPTWLKSAAPRYGAGVDASTRRSKHCARHFDC
jgi:transposase